MKPGGSGVRQGEADLRRALWQVRAARRSAEEKGKCPWAAFFPAPKPWWEERARAPWEATVWEPGGGNFARRADNSLHRQAHRVHAMEGRGLPRLLARGLGDAATCAGASPRPPAAAPAARTASAPASAPLPPPAGCLRGGPASGRWGCGARGPGWFEECGGNVSSRTDAESIWISIDWMETWSSPICSGTALTANKPKRTGIEYSRVPRRKK